MFMNLYLYLFILKISSHECYDAQFYLRVEDMALESGKCTQNSPNWEVLNDAQGPSWFYFIFYFLNNFLSIYTAEL